MIPEYLRVFRKPGENTDLGNRKPMEYFDTKRVSLSRPVHDTLMHACRTFGLSPSRMATYAIARFLETEFTALAEESREGNEYSWPPAATP